MNKHCESAKRFGKTATSAGKQRLEDFIRDSDGWAFEAAYRLAGNSEDAKELVQEALFRVVRAWDRFDSERPLEAWFLTVLRNLFYDTQARSERKHGVSLDCHAEDDEQSLHEKIAANEAGLDAALERSEDRDLVRRALTRLSDDHRAILRACDMEGSGYEAAAARFGVRLGTVRSRLSRARTAFRTAVTEINQGGLD